MIVMAVIGGVIIIALGLAAWYDRRAKQRGWRRRAFGGEAFQHRMDVDSMKNSMAQEGKQNWMTWRQRDRK